MHTIDEFKVGQYIWWIGEGTIQSKIDADHLWPESETRILYRGRITEISDDEIVAVECARMYEPDERKELRESGEEPEEFEAIGLPEDFCLTSDEAIDEALQDFKAWMLKQRDWYNEHPVEEENNSGQTDSTPNA